MSKVKYRLGLDIGAASLGWSVLKLDGSGSPCAIIAAGSRIFAEGRDSKSLATLAADRREARSARRQRDRFRQRQKFLLSELSKAGLFPDDKQEREALEILNPLELRARALTEKLPPHHIGRALFHLNQRRGFKSNRKDRSKENTSGKISGSVRLLMEEMGLIGQAMSREEYKELSKEERKQVRRQEVEERNQALGKLEGKEGLTYGSFLYRRQCEGKPTRARDGAGDRGKLYDVYPTRELYEDEFKKIWQAQARHHRALMTEEARERIRRAIFYQRPLKPQKRGKCTYLPDEDRSFRAMPSFQRYRIYQEVNSLEWFTSDGKFFLRNDDYRSARDAIIELLERVSTQKGQVPFRKMKKELKSRGCAKGGFRFNFETPKRTGFDGNLTSNIMQREDYVGAEWHQWPLDKQDKFIELILNDELTDDEVQQRLVKEYGLSEIAADKCANAPLEDGTANVSLEAARLMLEKMRDGIVDKETGEIRLPLQSEAATAVAKEVPEFKNPFRQKGDDGKYELQDRLLYYGEVFQDGRHIIPGNRLPQDQHDERKYFGGVTNPTVHIALNQIRLVVNELIDRYGHPDSIAIELGRELPVGAAGRREIDQEQEKNQERNQRFDAELRELGQQINRDNRLRLYLWEALDKDPNGRQCPFSGKKIGINDLFNGSTEVEHLIPFSISLDDSRANKVLCTRQANRDKGQRTPYEAFSNSPEGYNWHEIIERAKRLPKGNQWRFQPDAMEIWQRDYADFTERHLNDTRYIGRLTREYLECICHIDKIDVLTGRLTALLRNDWGLNSVLHGSKDAARKNRNDHRHHAIDAIVIGMTNKSMLQKAATEAGQAEELSIDKLFPRNANKSAIDPWDGFRSDVREAVRNIIVSHKVKRKELSKTSTDGQLHKETALGLIEVIDEAKNKYETVVRRPIDYLTETKHVEAIRDGSLREKFLNAFKNGHAGEKGKEAVKKLASECGIRHIRCFGPEQAIPIMDKEGKPYKAYQGGSNWGIEIYAFPAGHKKANKWEGVVVSSFVANQKGFKPGQTCKPHPAARLIMRLQINECVEIEEGGEKKIMRVQKIGQNGLVTFAPHNEANVASRHINRNVKVRYKGEDYTGTKAREKITIKVGKKERKIKYSNSALERWQYEDDFFFLEKPANTLRKLNPRKVHISPTGQLSYEKRRQPRRKKK